MNYPLITYDEQAMVTLMDGGMGQELLRRSGREATPLWSAEVMLNEPDLVTELHADFIRSGATVLTLNTYTATPERLERDNAIEHFEHLHASAGQAATAAIDIAGVDGIRIGACLPPLVASYRADVSLPFEQSLSTYRRLVALQAPYADIFLCETMSSLTEARAAATAGLETGKPVWLGLTISDSHPEVLRGGESLADALAELKDLGLEAILLNCSPPEAIDRAWPTLSTLSLKYGAYGNGFVSVDELQPGGTVKQLQAREDLGPERYTDYAMQWVRSGASIVGGCCEIGPAHIKCLHTALAKESLG